MFIAMNRFQVSPGSEEAFETLWASRESYLDTVPGFIEFHLLRGPKTDEFSLYSTHTTFESKAAFEGWTQSEQFRKSHARATNSSQPSLYIGHPKFEGFEIIQTLGKTTAAA